jgi:hypothetical protein
MMQQDAINFIDYGYDELFSAAVDSRGEAALGEGYITRDTFDLLDGDGIMGDLWRAVALQAGSGSKCSDAGDAIDKHSCIEASFEREAGKEVREI